MTTNDFNYLKHFISGMNTELKETIASTETCLENQISTLCGTLNVEMNALKTSVEEFKEKISSDVTSIKNHIDEHANRLNNANDDIQRMKYTNDLRLTGFAMAQNENLYDIFNALSLHIGYDTNNNLNIAILNRVPYHDPTTGQSTLSSTIIMHFTTSQHKQHFYSKYLSKIPLKPEQFGLSKENHHW